MRNVIKERNTDYHSIFRMQIRGIHPVKSSHWQLTVIVAWVQIIVLFYLSCVLFYRLCFTFPSKKSAIFGCCWRHTHTRWTCKFLEGGISYVIFYTQRFRKLWRNMCCSWRWMLPKDMGVRGDTNFQITNIIRDF